MGHRSLTLPDGAQRIAVLIMQTGLLLLLLYTLVTVRLGLALGVAFGLGVTLLPALVRHEYGYSMDPLLALWVTLSISIHTFGSLGPYDWFSWYDSVAHTVSAVVIASIGYVILRTFEEHSPEIDVPGEFRAVFIVVFVLAAGVFWELLEFASGALARSLGAEAPLAVKGVDDIVTDLVFNTLGALIVAAFGTGYLGGLVSFARRRLLED
ncbi:hypothetical protein [Halobacterium wangiae]|uniref:hypothetical protein n=1 Tax=Halobacterium wangiae TaxID=2902623 RepID=UPI001E432BD4|nr:hypothetical protein [Halobacterium wangiae]